MTVFPDARTSSAAVHALSGSSRPGAAPPPASLASVHEMPDPFVPLGGAAAGVVAGLAARRPHPDAAVIDLAARVKRLVEREHRLWDRQSAIEDAVDAETPLRPVDIADASSFQEAVAAHDRRVVEVGARLGLPRIEKLSGRVSRRIDRWGARLAGMAPQTQAGLAAKAAASVASTARLRAPLEHLRGWHKDLSVSVGDDALRIIGAEADEVYRADQERDGELLALGRAWRDCADRHERALIYRDEVDERRTLVDPPEALYLDPTCDPPVLAAYSKPRGEAHRPWYGNHNTIAALRRPWHYAFCCARRDEILKAYDAWTIAQDAEEEASGFAAAEAALWSVAEENRALRKAILTIPARTPEGALLKVDVACWCMGDVEGMEVDHAGHVREGEADEEALTCGALLDIVRVFGRSRQAAAAPVPLDFIEFPAGRYPADMPRDVIETYRTFLARELRFLNAEVYGWYEGEPHLWLDNPAGRLHGCRDPGPATRAAAVLGLLGLMPVPGVDGRGLAAAQAAASAA